MTDADCMSTYHLLCASLQTNADKADTFSPRHISLKPEAYEEMLRTWALPLKAIESTSAVGPFFWSVLDRDSDHPDKPHLRMC